MTPEAWTAIGVALFLVLATVIGWAWKSVVNLALVVARVNTTLEERIRVTDQRFDAGSAKMNEIKRDVGKNTVALARIEGKLDRLNGQH